MTEIETADFFLELLLEEMPANAIAGARAELARMFTDVLAEEDLGAEPPAVLATPRRLIVLVRHLPLRQADRVVEVAGPPAEKAIDAAGRPSAAAVGFARAQGVEVSQLVKARTPRGDVLMARKTIAGRDAADILAERLPQILRAMSFPKMMRWGAGRYAFVRPLHGIVALLGDRLVEFEAFGVSSGRETVGHRLGPPAGIEVSSFDDYLRKLRAGGVEPDGEERAMALLEAARSLAAEAGGTVEADADLIPLLADMVEWPGLVRGSFDPSFLDLPDEVLITTMRTHQKYLPVRGPRGLTGAFLAVMDNPEDRRGFIAKGNEWVINARLSDARFFCEVDTREPFAGKLERLSHLAFHERLGDYLQKTGRLQELSEEIGTLVTRPEKVRFALEAARLCKIDLTTEMVREFPDLQGVMGGTYLRREGAPEEVWKAVYDHYRPGSVDDEPPRTETGAIVSLADRVDTLAGFFGVSLLPTGSKDPYGLRRAAQGIVLIVLSRGWRADWRSVFRKAIRLYGAALTETPEAILARLDGFFADRVRFLFEKRGLPGDVISAVLAAGSWDFADLADRARALEQARRRETFRLLSLSVKRIGNILGDAEPGEPSASLFREAAEHALAADFAQLSDAASRLIAARRYPELIDAMTSLSPALDRYFTDVLVNAPEADLRRNRQALLAAIQREFRKFADISEIVVEK